MFTNQMFDLKDFKVPLQIGCYLATKDIKSNIKTNNPSLNQINTFKAV